MLASKVVLTFKKEGEGVAVRIEKSLKIHEHVIMMKR
jgi:hypothetical protein